MKTTFFSRALGTTSIALACLLFPLTSQAKDKHHGGGSSHYHGDHHDDHHDYYSHPHSNFTLSFGTGYAGTGYYYGPPNVPYYYERPYVRYYATRSLVPRQYYSSSNSIDASVQRELANRGYYHGYIDGAIGPQSRQAIARYQQDHGLLVTGQINSSLLNSLGL